MKQKIYALKKRPSNNPLIIHFKSIEDIKKEVVINKNFLIFYQIIRFKFW